MWQRGHTAATVNMFLLVGLLVARRQLMEWTWSLHGSKYWFCNKVERCCSWQDHIHEIVLWLAEIQQQFKSDYSCVLWNMSEVKNGVTRLFLKGFNPLKSSFSLIFPLSVRQNHKYIVSTFYSFTLKLYDIDIYWNIHFSLRCLFMAAPFDQKEIF